MKKTPKLRLSEDGRLPDGGLRFVVRLPKELSDLFEAEMKVQDRKKMPLARFIIHSYFRERFARKEVGGFMSPQTEVKKARGPHFGGKSYLRQDAAV